MGMFSWITTDTKKSIRSTYADDYSPQTIYMRDNKGNVWIEDAYEGYGVFGGKDYYQLLAEMNKVEGLTGDVDEDRGKGIDLAFSDEPFISPTLNGKKESPWVNNHNDMCPGQGYY